jgi:rod shape determining protein RodA
MKLFLIIALAKYLHDDPRSEGRGLSDLLVPAIIAGVPTLLVLTQPDLGTALILGLTFATLCLLTKIRWQSLATLVVVSGVLSPIVWNYVLKDYQKKRVTDFLNPDANLLGSGWHAHHARVAI